jgi:hypothetical protein
LDFLTFCGICESKAVSRCACRRTPNTFFSSLLERRFPEASKDQSLVVLDSAPAMHHARVVEQQHIAPSPPDAYGQAVGNIFQLVVQARG